MQQAYSRLLNRLLQNQELGPKEELPDIVCELGYRYTEGALCRSSEDENMAKTYEDPYEPHVLPGGRLPHIWLTTGTGGRISSLDLIKRNFVLFTTDSDSPWLRVAQEQNIPLDFYVINSSSLPFHDHQGSARQTWKLKTGEALLVRPDGIIAWRSGRGTGSHAEKLSEALQTILRC